jgi:hypothetical protein
VKGSLGIKYFILILFLNLEPLAADPSIVEAVAAPSVIETVKPVEEEASNIFFKKLGSLCNSNLILFRYLEPVLAAADVIDPVKLVEEVVGKLFFQGSL